MKLKLVREPAAYSRWGKLSIGVHPDDASNPSLATKVDKIGNTYPNPWHGNNMGYSWVSVSVTDEVTK